MAEQELRDITKIENLRATKELQSTGSCEKPCLPMFWVGTAQKRRLILTEDNF